MSQQCSKCGDCCRFLLMPFVDDVLLREFLDARGITYTVVDNVLSAKVPHVCKQLLGNLCILHDDKKPIACKDFHCEGVLP